MRLRVADQAPMTSDTADGPLLIHPFAMNEPTPSATGLPPEAIEILQPYFTDFDLRRISMHKGRQRRDDGVRDIEFRRDGFGGDPVHRMHMAVGPVSRDNIQQEHYQ